MVGPVVAGHPLRPGGRRATTPAGERRLPAGPRRRGPPVCWLATRLNPSSEKALIAAVTPPPDGIKWLVTQPGWIGSLGLLVVVVVLALVSRRVQVIRDSRAGGCRRLAPVRRL